MKAGERDTPWRRPKNSQQLRQLGLHFVGKREKHVVETLKMELQGELAQRRVCRQAAVENSASNARKDFTACRVEPAVLKARLEQRQTAAHQNQRCGGTETQFKKASSLHAQVCCRRASVASFAYETIEASD